MSENFNASQAIREFMHKNDISRAALARALDVNAANLDVRLDKGDIRVDFLMRVCRVLKHNFFRDIAATLPEGFSTADPADNTKDERIKELELEVKILERERNMLAGIIGNSRKS